jgi:hypothetical protein
MRPYALQAELEHLKQADRARAYDHGIGNGVLAGFWHGGKERWRETAKGAIQREALAEAMAASSAPLILFSAPGIGVCPACRSIRRHRAAEPCAW